MIRAVIIDDEKASRDTLVGMLSRYCKNVEVAGQADGYQSGLEEIEKCRPDVVFLDIQMPDGSGFKLLEDIKEINFEIIFTTAYDQYAIKAIKYSALDYLLKPIVPDDLVSAVAKTEQKKNSGLIHKNLKVLVENLTQKAAPKKIVLHTARNIHIHDLDDIIRCESDDYYTRYFFTNAKPLLVSSTLKENEELLNDPNFVRPHKSHLVNVKHIKGFLSDGGDYIVMTDGAKIPVARRKKDQILTILTNQ
jgi:two-component system, LytTR family, response regulator